jgi:cytochrome c5
MKTLKFLPLVAALALAACGEKAKPTPETGADKSTPAVTAAPASPTPSAPAAGTTATATPATPAASAEAPAASATTATATTSTATTTAGGDLAKGEKVYTATCLACHGAGVMGAPKFGDKAAWAPRIAQGKDKLYTNALNGIRMMPPKGGNAALKDDELKAAVDYMISKAS